MILTPEIPDHLSIQSALSAVSVSENIFQLSVETADKELGSIPGSWSWSLGKLKGITRHPTESFRIIL